MSDRSETVNEENRELELPPAFQKFVDQLKADRKQLMRDKAYGQSADQLRAFIGQYLFARIGEMVELLGLAIYDVYGLAVSNANQQQRMRAHVNKQLRKLGASVGGDDEELPGVGPEVVNELQQAVYGLGTVLEKKLPNDKEAQDAYNRVVTTLSAIVGKLMGQDEGEEDDEEDEDEDDEEDEAEGKEPEKTDGKAEKADEKPETDGE